MDIYTLSNLNFKFLSEPFVSKVLKVLLLLPPLIQNLSQLACGLKLFAKYCE